MHTHYVLGITYAKREYSTASAFKFAQVQGLWLKEWYISQIIMTMNINKTTVFNDGAADIDGTGFNSGAAALAAVIKLARWMQEGLPSVSNGTYLSLFDIPDKQALRK